MELNPILSRELRGRWRGLSGFLLVFAYVSAASTLFIANYARAGTVGSRHPATLGRDTFIWLAWVQTLACILIPPALAATSISSDRANGLLESVRLSRLTDQQIILGKFGAVLASVLLMLLLVLPLQGWCILLGGTEPAAALRLWLLQLATIAFWCAVSLLCSAWHQTDAAALRATFGLVLLWAALSGCCLFFPAPPGGTVSSYSWFRFEGSQFLVLSNPLAAIQESFSQGHGALTRVDGAWRCTMIVQLGAMPLLLLAAGRNLRPTEPAHWIRRRTNDLSTRSQVWELPPATFWRFQNPVMQHEFVCKFRMRQAPLVVIVIEALLGVAVLAVYLLTLWSALFNPPSRPTIWWSLTLIALVVVTLASTVTGASSVTREKETGTWANLLITPLTMRQILVGKASAAVLAVLVFSTAFWPLALSCVAYRAAWPHQQIVSWAQAVACWEVLLGVSWWYAALGVMFSCAFRRTSVAVGWGVVTALASLFMPLQTLMKGGPSSALLLYPPAALTAIYAPNSSALWTGLGFLLGMGAGGAFFLFLGCVFAEGRLLHRLQSVHRRSATGRKG